jgi:hypothetical protein
MFSCPGEGFAVRMNLATKTSWSVHADRCPVGRSLRGAIDITTSIDLTGA